MANPFFPNVEFAYAFAAVLFGGLIVASWFDLKTLIVPKKVTIGLLAAGALANVVRGAWLGADGHPAWVIDSSGPVVGAIDGLLFAVAGFLVGFGLFFVLWIFGVCGGGDVKLAAAVGAWVGPRYFLGTLAIALPVLFILTFARLGLAILRGKPRTAGQKQEGRGLQWRLMSYSLPMTIAVGILSALLVIGAMGFRIQVGAPPPPAGQAGR